MAVSAPSWSDGAHRFLKRCASAGNLDACYSLGMIQFYCLEDRRGGATLLARAALGGHAHALHSLSVIHFNGSSGTRLDRDLLAGVLLCAKAAAQGHVEALRELGHCLQDGYGVPRNVAEGRRLLLEANTREAATVAAATAATAATTAAGAAGTSSVAVGATTAVDAAPAGAAAATAGRAGTAFAAAAISPPPVATQTVAAHAPWRPEATEAVAGGAFAEGTVAEGAFAGGTGAGETVAGGTVTGGAVASRPQYRTYQLSLSIFSPLKLNPPQLFPLRDPPSNMSSRP
ncbi:unnamed protein product [Closterium sp. NIES-65]|nr:unnamed protein product [Closterium sp. NIES-65]